MPDDEIEEALELTVEELLQMAADGKSVTIRPILTPEADRA